MCAFVAVCRHPGGADEDAEPSTPGPQKAQKAQIEMPDQVRFDFDSAPRAAAGNRRCAGAAAGGRSAAQRRARGVGGHRQDARAGRSLRAAARSRRRAAQHPGDHLHAQGRGGNAPARDGDAAAAASRGRASAPARWREIRDAFNDISISTIDAFCLSLLHEFPLEAGVDPGFDLADETETPRFVESSLDSALAIGRAISLDDPDVALLFTELGEPRLRKALTALLDRRLVARDALNRFLRGREMTIDAACHRLLHALRGAVSSISVGDDRAVQAFIATGPGVPGFDLLAREMRELMADPPLPPARLRGAARSAVGSRADQAGRAAQAAGPYSRREFRSPADYERHKVIVVGTRSARAGGGRGVQARHQPGPGARRAAAVRDRAGRIPPHPRQARRARLSPICSSAR